MKMQFKVLTLALMAALAGCNSSSDEQAKNTQTSTAVERINDWFNAGRDAVEEAAQTQPNTQRAKNVILFVGDGMGVSTVTAARILEGQQADKTGEENWLSFESMPYVALAKTYNTNQQTPDSAGTMTAMMSGVKTKAGVIGVAENSVRANCASTKGKELVSALMLAEAAGKSTGIISTARLTHATPAATYAISPERNWEDDADLPAEAVANGCKDIASQLIDFPYGNGIEVALGGGRRHFLPDTQTDPEDNTRTGNRADSRDLTQEWVSKQNNAAYVWDKAGFDAVDTATTDHLLGLFERSHMNYEVDRTNDIGGEPSLAEMTTKSIDMLKKNDKGFFLMVEAGRIDHGHHAGSAYYALNDAIAFSDAVRAAREATDDEDTLILVTADHSHVFTIAGYPTRGNPILGKVVGNDSSGAPQSAPALALDGKPYTTVGYTNDRGFATGTPGDAIYGVGKADIFRGRADLTNVDTQDPGFHQEALVPLSSETHAGEDVAIYASGPWAHLVQGTLEQNAIFHIMNKAAGLTELATAP